MPLTIDASNDIMESQESMTSPIVIHDKMLSHSAVSPATFDSPRGVNSISPQQQDANSSSLKMCEQKTNNVDAFVNYIDSDALNKVLMDFNPSQDYQGNLF